MQPLTFPCPRCDRRMGVGIESAGKAVRCPYCQEVVAAPTLSVPPPIEPPPPAPLKDLFASIQNREGADSILADPEDSDDSVFSAFEMKKPPLLPLPVPLQTPRAPVASTPPAVAPKHSAAPFGGFAANPTSTPEGSEAKAPIEKGTAFSFDWKLLALIAMAGYAALMTALAAWGWMRSPTAKDAVHPVQKAK